MVEIKFCGLTRAEDAREAAELGARYAGVILTRSPRELSDAAATGVLAALAAEVARVGVFGAASPAAIAERAARLELDVIQLHGDADPEAVQSLRRHWNGTIWAALRVAGDRLPAHAAALAQSADALLLDTRVPGKEAQGGTGVALPWDALAEDIGALRGSGKLARLVLAGGLRPENVSRAIELLRPDVVDVSSGVESAAGVKDHQRMRAFRDAVMAVAPA